MLKDKIVFISGSSRGIGKSIAEIFAKYNATLIINGRNKVKLEEVAQNIIDLYKVNVFTSVFDVSCYEQVKIAFKDIYKVYRKIDVLINNAGILDDALIGMVTHKQILKTFETNTFSTLYLSQYASRFMMKNKTGSIINISSIIGTNGNSGQVVYAGSKAAVNGITKSLAKELAQYNIRVNAIAPGFIDTDMTKQLPKDKYKERLESIKIGRIGTSEDIANTALFLASDLSSYVTGQIIGVDGGMLI